MSIISKLFGKKDNTSAQSAEDFMSLVRVYFQSVLGAKTSSKKLIVLSKSMYVIRIRSSHICLCIKVSPPT